VSADLGVLHGRRPEAASSHDAYRTKWARPELDPGNLAPVRPGALQSARASAPRGRNQCFTIALIVCYSVIPRALGSIDKAVGGANVATALQDPERAVLEAAGDVDILPAELHGDDLALGMQLAGGCEPAAAVEQAAFVTADLAGAGGAGLRQSHGLFDGGLDGAGQAVVMVETQRAEFLLNLDDRQRAGGSGVTALAMCVSVPNIDPLSASNTDPCAMLKFGVIYGAYVASDGVSLGRR
jgi:hypothetical protein